MQCSEQKSIGRFRKKSLGIKHLQESQEDSQIPDKADEWPIFNFNLPNSLVIVVSVETEGKGLDMAVHTLGCSQCYYRGSLQTEIQSGEVAGKLSITEILLWTLAGYC